MIKTTKKLVYLGAKEVGYECFRYLHKHSSLFNVEIIGVITNKRGIKLKEYCKDNQINIIDSLDAMLKLEDNIDFIISVQFDKILKQRHIAKADIIAINLHMAPLPEYRGCNQFSYAIIDEKKEFGATLHKLDNRIDNGGIIAERRFAIPEKCWVKELYNLTYENSVALFKDEIGNILNNKFKIIPQNQLVKTRGTSLHFRKEIEKLKNIDLSWERAKIEKYIRATSMPGFSAPYVIIDNNKIYFKILN